MGNSKTLSIKNIIAFIVIVSLIILSIYSIDIIMMLFASFVINCAIAPLINRMEKRMPRIWCVTLVLLGLIVASFLILIPLIRARRRLMNRQKHIWKSDKKGEHK